MLTGSAFSEPHTPCQFATPPSMGSTILEAASEEQPHLSVVLPAKNRPGTAVEAIQSAQPTTGNLEVIIQDCGEGEEDGPRPLEPAES